MSSQPTVAVALSVRDGADYLADAIESVLAQEGVDLELRIYDNLSTDASYAIARSFADDRRVTVVRGPEDYGFCGSMNRALSETDAELFVPWSADDVMLPGNLARKAEAIRATAAAWSFGPMNVIGPDGRLLFVQEPYLGAEAARIEPPTVFARFIPENKLPASGPVIRTDVLRAAGGFDSRVPKCPDWKLWLELGLRHAAAWLPEPLFSYRWHDASGTNEAWAAGTFARDLPPTLRHVFAAADVPAEIARHRDEAYVLLCAHLAKEMRERGAVRVGDTTYSSVTVAADALLRVEQPGTAWEYLRAEAGRAGLHPPTGDLIAAPAPSHEQISSTLGAMRRLHDRDIARSLVLTANEAVAEHLAPLVERYLASEGDLDLTLVIAPALADVLRPGMLLVAPHGAATIAEAETCGVPALAVDVPDPLARPRVAERWELPALEPAA
ncbi:MAG TPA: glycosyltransferase [Gaiellales bacterium]|jgi:hypothetical protein